MKTLPAPGIRTVVSIGAGFCSALLFTLAKQQTWAAVSLAHLAPLPVMIATMGFGQLSGSCSALIAATAIGLLAALHQEAISNANVLAGLIAGVAFALIVALPAWWLGFLSCLGRPEDPGQSKGSGRWRIQSADKKPVKGFVFYPIGQILVHAAVIAACIVMLATAALAVRYGSFDAALDHLTEQCLPDIKNFVDAHPELNALDPRSLTQLMLNTIPAAWTLMIFLGNLWLAGQIVLASSRLPRPWPNIAHELRVPRLLILALAAALGLCILKDDWLNAIGLITLVTFGLAYTLQGVAVVHELTQKSRWRVPLLFILYTTLILFMPLSLALFAVVALFDTALSLRNRKTTLISSKT